MLSSLTLQEGNNKRRTCGGSKSLQALTVSSSTPVYRKEVRSWGEKDFARNSNSLSYITLPRGQEQVQLRASSALRWEGSWGNKAGLVLSLPISSDHEPLEKPAMSFPYSHSRSLIGLICPHTWSFSPHIPMRWQLFSPILQMRNLKTSKAITYGHAICVCQGQDSDLHQSDFKTHWLPLKKNFPSISSSLWDTAHLFSYDEGGALDFLIHCSPATLMAVVFTVGLAAESYPPDTFLLGDSVGHMQSCWRMSDTALPR